MSRNPIRMVDVGEKPITSRVAKAHATVRLAPTTLQAITEGTVPKGDVLSVARIAGIQAAKETSRMLPLCHPIPLENVELEFKIHTDRCEIEIIALTRAEWKTGVEMEAMCAVSAAALTIYDMCKALERGITITEIELLEKHGGKSKSWTRAARS